MDRGIAYKLLLETLAEFDGLTYAECVQLTDGEFVTKTQGPDGERYVVSIKLRRGTKRVTVYGSAALASFGSPHEAIDASLTVRTDC